MIKPINKSTNYPKFKADTHTIDDKTGEYKDPMMKWPLRGAAFTNEIGEALRPIIGGYATLSWAPALMYIGADIYDKYKNDQNEYSPNSRRCLKQAVFQGMASVFLPLVAVKAGQNVFSQLGKLSDEKISLNAKEQISKVAEEFIANGKMRAYHNKDGECIKEFLDIVNNKIDYKQQKLSAKNPLSKIWYSLEDKFSKFLKINSKTKKQEYAEKTIKDLIDLRKNILNPSTEFAAGKLYSNYNSALKNGQTNSVAVKSVLTKYQNNTLMKGNFIKTIGGFVALGMFIKPIDHFVENVLIGKYVGPKIDRINKSDIKNK